jgi:hypothetical protein
MMLAVIWIPGNPTFLGDSPLSRGNYKKLLLVSEALPIFGASYYFCACSDLSLLYEAYDFSSHSEV